MGDEAMVDAGQVVPEVLNEEDVISELASEDYSVTSEEAEQRMITFFKEIATEMQYAVNGMSQEIERCTASREELHALMNPDFDGAAPPKVDSQVGVSLRRLFNIDISSHTFDLCANLRFRWKMSAHERPPMHWDTDWVPNWVPKFRVMGVMEEKMREDHFEIIELEGEKWVDHECMIIVTVFQELDLRYFPVDCQALDFVLESEYPVSVCEWAPLEYRTLDKDAAKDSVAKRGSRRKQKLKAQFHNKVVDLHQGFLQGLSTMKLVTTAELPGLTYSFQKAQNEEGVKKSLVKVSIKVQRVPTNLLLNIMGISFMITCLAAAQWFLHPADIAGRADLNFTLLLTAAVLKLMVAEILEFLPYVTLLDYYVLFCNTTLAVTTAVSVVLPFWRGVRVVDNSVLTMPPNTFVMRNRAGEEDGRGPYNLWESETADEQDVVNTDFEYSFYTACVWFGFNLIYAVVFLIIQCLTRRWCIAQAMKEMSVGVQ